MLGSDYIMLGNRLSSLAILAGSIVFGFGPSKGNIAHKVNETCISGGQADY